MVEETVPPPDGQSTSGVAAAGVGSQMSNAKKIFISYSTKNPEHEKRVKNLASYMRTTLGYDVTYADHKLPSEKWSDFINKNLEKGKDRYVMVVCDTHYMEDVNAFSQEVEETGWAKKGKSPRVPGKGVRAEISVIYRRMYEEEGNGGWLIPTYFNMASAEVEKLRQEKEDAEDSSVLLVNEQCVPLMMRDYNCYGIEIPKSGQAPGSCWDDIDRHLAGEPLVLQEPLTKNITLGKRKAGLAAGQK